GVVDHANFADADAFVDPHAIVAAGTSVESDKTSLRRYRNLTPARDLVVRCRNERVDRRRALVAAAALAHRHRAVLDLAIADHQQVPDPLPLRPPGL